jgi:phage terminase large subunit-like protein
LILAGRGWGKTRVAAETVRAWVESGKYGRIALVAETAADARDVIVEGESGILAISPPWNKPVYEPSKRRLTWPNGAVATLYNGTEPDQLRGPQHDAAVIDELAKYAHAQATFDQLQFGLRLGDDPRLMVTTTPRPVPVIKSLIKDPRTVVTRGSTLDNAANLAPTFMAAILDRFEGTRLGRQELNAEILEDIEGALWTRAMLDACRIKPESLPQMQRIVVAIDPSGTSGKPDNRSDAVGIIVAGRGQDGKGYVLEDLTCNASPAAWGRVAVSAYHRHRADRIIAERNFGGAMVAHVISTVDPLASYAEVVATRGKAVRAEPVAALYEKGMVHHAGPFEKLEDQMASFSTAGYMGDKSPDRADALVWALTDLMVGATPSMMDVL